MQENRAYSVAKPILSQQNPPPPFPVLVMAMPAGDAKGMAMLPDLNALTSGLAVIIFEYGPSREDGLTGREDGLTGRDDGSLAAGLRKATNVQVQLAGEGVAVEKGKIYIVPAGAGIQVSEERFVFTLTISPGAEPYLPDLLLARLAYHWGERVIAVLISDQTSAGFTGCRVVRDEGGFAFVLTDRHHSGNSIGAAEAAGCIDGQFRPAQLTSRLLSLVDYPGFADRLRKKIPSDKASLGRIYRLLLHKSGVNFSVYRLSDIVIRLVRRMVLTRIDELQAYAAYLEKHEQEVSHLYRDLLTAEAGFLFEPALGQMLEKDVMPRILSDRKGLQPFRIWITGCSVGEMAFSVAMRISEYLEVRSPGLALQLFVTGLNRRAVERARAGVYEESSLYYVTPAQRKKFFVNKEGLYHVIKPVREMCIFATHLLMADPPFSHIDLIITDNVMAYLSDNERRNVSQSFHYALNIGGRLMVKGGAPAQGLRADLFAPVQHVSGIYTRKEVPVSSFYPATFTQALPNAEKEAGKILMSGYVSPGMLVDEELRVVRFYGIASPYLKRPGDHPSLHLLKIVKDEIMFELSELLRQVDRSRQPATREDIFLLDNEVGIAVSIDVIPILFAERKWRLIVIREKGMSRQGEGHSGRPALSNQWGRRISALEKELQRVRHQLRSAHKLFNDTQKNLQTLYEEAQATNEELQSANEELQSVNEELEATNEGLKMAIERLKLSEQFKDEFVAIASHELKTPATSIQAYTQILHEELQQSGDTRSVRIAERLNAQVNHLSRLTRDLLDITQVSNGQLALREAWFDLGTLVDEVVEGIGLTTSIRITTDDIQRDLSIWGDRERITQVLVNLLSNAIKYSPESGEINISSRISGDAMQLMVQDFGIGMSLDTLEKVFDRFYRSDDPSVLQRPGLGLGLYIAADIVRRHGGSIAVKSKKGKGSVFTVTLPIGKRE